MERVNFEKMPTTPLADDGVVILQTDYDSMKEEIRAKRKKDGECEVCGTRVGRYANPFDPYSPPCPNCKLKEDK